MGDRLKLVELTIDEDKGEGIFAISLVDRPAIEQNFMFFNSKKPYQFKIDDEEKRQVAGPILIPNLEIYREDQAGNPYNVFFSDKTVNRLSQLYLQEKRQDSTTAQHLLPIKGVTMVQSWIINNPKQDTYLSYQPDQPLPKGTWYGVFTVENDEVWAAIKSGEFKGFSIEMIGTEIELQTKKSNNMSVKENSLMTAIISLAKKFGHEEEGNEEHQLASVELADGSMLVSDDETFVIGNPVFIETEGNREPAAPGEYVGSNESIYVVDADGNLAEIKEPEAVPADEELSVELSEVKEALGVVVEILTGIHASFETQKAEGKTALDAVKTELSETKAKLVELSGPAGEEQKKDPKGNGKVNNTPVVSLKSLKGKSQPERLAALKKAFGN